jgi:hypothetical protein
MNPLVVIISLPFFYWAYWCYKNDRAEWLVILALGFVFLFIGLSYF